MDSLIQTFHLDIKLLFAQLVNFSVAFCVLYFFGLKPLFKAMNERSSKIAKSLEEGKEIEKKLAQTEEDYKKGISRAKKEAGELLAKAGEQAQERQKEMLAKAKEDIAKIIGQEKEKIAADKKQAIQEIKTEVADLVVASVEKVLSERVDLKKDKEIIEKVASEK